MRPQLRRYICPVTLDSLSNPQISRQFPAHPSLGPASLRSRQQLSVSSFARRTPNSQSSASVRPPYPSRTGNSTKQSVSSRFPDPGPETRSRVQLESNSLYTVFGTALLAVGVFTFYTQATKDTKEVPDQSPEELLETMSYHVPPGRPENLTPEQEEKLRKLWTAIFQLCGVADDDTPSSSLFTAAEEPGTGTADAPKKKRLGVFSKNRESKSGTSTPTVSEEDKYGQTKQFYETLANETPESIRATIWSMVKHDHPDALALRFLRARKWDVDKALVMFVSTMSWRHLEMHVDDDIMKNGDCYAVEDEKNKDSLTRQVSKDFMAQLRMGKSFLHGTDRNGRPICVVRVRLHKIGAECEESLERYTVHTIETARMVLTHPVDTACVLFDMTGFSMANMDYTPVKFMIKCFEANYPESLGTVLVHRAPWIFQGIWRMIRGWLDPVVASKVHFTNNRAELEEFIEPSHIIKELDGDEDWEYKYIEPTAGENTKLKDTATRDKLLAAREEIVKKFEHATRQWIRHPASEQTKAIKAEREQLAVQLREDYWNLDPYIRARSIYDRQGAIRPDGTTRWYPTAAVNGQKAPETSADDVD